MPEMTITLITATILLLLSGAAQVTVFNILSLKLRDFIRAILWITIAASTALLLAVLWTFGPFTTLIIALYLLADLALPVLAYIKRGQDMLDLRGLVDSVDKIIEEVEHGRSAKNIR